MTEEVKDALEALALRNVEYDLAQKDFNKADSWLRGFHMSYLRQTAAGLNTRERDLLEIEAASEQHAAYLAMQAADNSYRRAYSRVLLTITEERRNAG
jgi:hypothetical protein